MSNVSLKYRLLIYFLSLVILPTSIISVIIYNESIRTIKENIDTTLQRNLATAEMALVQKIEEMEATANAIYLNPEMTELLSADRPSDQVGIVNELASLNNMMASYDLPGVQSREFTLRLYMLDRPEYAQYNFSNYVSPMSSIEREDWYYDLPPKQRYSILAFGPGSGSAVSDGHSIVLAKRLFGLRNATIPYVGLLTVQAEIDEFNIILAEMKPSVNSTIAIFDDSRTTVASSAGWEGDGTLPGPIDVISAGQWPGPEIVSQDMAWNGEAWLASSRRIDSLGWTMLSVSPVSDLNGKLVELRQVMYILLAACMLAAFLLALWLSGNITNPIRKFIKMMTYAQSGNFDVQIQYQRKDEFTYLFSQYNVMMRKIKGLIDELYVSEVRKKEAELKALQAQINPHFLYNTLDSINWIALRHKVPDISHMVTSLSDFFRYSLSKGQDIIPIEDELKQVASYLSIQQIRFKEKLTYTIEVEPEVLGYDAVKLTLQPLVENSLVHGIEKKRGGGHVRISARHAEGRVEIEIVDDGIGASAEWLNGLLAAEDGQSFGLSNVNERIRQVFGEPWGIRFLEHEGAGVMVSVSFPARKTGGEKRDEA
ncbi:cache domain-containing sensor histidine kinase [Paenibacillus sp. 1P07SE]|uniref:cache domain-containing sensor histidine kinase n=1 Tax=Paenibacillus sp. 1P07SE TaxID=3132209 RepID=UPI0039A7004E